MTELPLAVFDIDGVLADVRHRLRHVRARPKDWDAFFAAAVDDPPHTEGVELARGWRRSHELVLLTGRPDKTRPQTERWLAAHGFGEHRLVMRPAGDRRPAAVVKVELLAELARGRELAVVVDDDPMVVDALRRAGFPVHHADWERRAGEEQATLLEAQEVEGRS